MTEGLLKTLQAIDPKLLTDFVRQDQNDPSFEISSWDVQRLSDKGISNPDGLWRFSGQGAGAAGNRPWAIVLKILSRQKEEPALYDLWHWKREYYVAQSEWAVHLPVKAPRFYHCEETPEGAWIWMEHIEDRQTGKWTLDEYAFAAYQLGRWHSTYLMGTSLPNADWLTREHYRSWLRFTNPEEAWRFSLNQKHVPFEVRERYQHLWNEREIFCKVLEGLPRVFSHFDSQRRNLFIRTNKNDQNELIAIDWQQCGIGALGAELNWLIAMSGLLLEWNPSDLVRLDQVAFERYIQGLQAGGWSGNVEHVRLGYTAMVAVFIGCTFPSVALFWCSPENREFTSQIFGMAGEDFYLETLPVFHYALDCAKEARGLTGKLDLL